MEKRRTTPYLSATILICCISLLHLSARASETGADASPPSSAGNDLRVVITKIAKSIMPMVVHIEVTQQQLVQFSPYIESPQSPFFDQPQVQKKFKRELKGLGTAFLLTKPDTSSRTIMWWTRLPISRLSYPTESIMPPAW
jgi:hypothetical protein